MPELFQNGEKGEKAQAASDRLQEVADALEQAVGDIGEAKE